MSVENIILSPAKIYYAPPGEAPPSENSVDYGDDWGGNWVDVGWTNVPLSLNVAIETYEVMVEQESLPVKEIKTKETYTFETQLVEITGDNLVLAFPGATATDTTATTGQVAKSEVEAGGGTALDTYAWGIEGYLMDASNNVLPVRLFIYKGNPLLNGELQFSKSKETGIPLQIKCKPDMTKDEGKRIFKWQIVTGPKDTAPA